MKSQTTFVWFLLAAVLAAAIWLLNHVFQPAAPGEKPVLAGLVASHITGIQIIPAGGREISVTRTNQGWQLEQPLAYPAQAAAIDGLLEALEKLTPSLSLSAAELSARKDAEAEFGFDHPQFKLDLSAGDQIWHLLVGNKTAPGDGVYVRAVGATGVDVTDTAWLQFLPLSVTDWRDTTLVDVPANLDWLVITNGTQTIELRRAAGSHLWRLVRPFPARANDLRIATALASLQNASISRFITDDPKADPGAYGLEPAALDVWLGSGTNWLAAVHVGRDTGTNNEVFARREGWPAIVTTPRPPLAVWQGSVNDFRDTNLLELTAPVAEIEMHQEENGYTNNYTLQQRVQSGSNVWVMAGEKFATDPASVATLIRTLVGLHIVDFVQDAVTPARLQSYGLARPAHTITLRSAAGDSNSVLAQIFLGVTTNHTVLVKRSDEDFVYALPLADLGRLSLPGDYFREHRLWSFSETNVASVTLRQNGKTRQLLRTGTFAWSLAPGSQGIINPPAVDETVHNLGGLTALAWIGRKFTDAEVGVTTNSLSVTIELKNGEKYAVTFGNEQTVPAQNTTTALAVATLDGERWAFVFPPVLCHAVADYLTIPADTPTP